MTTTEPQTMTEQEARDHYLSLPAARIVDGRLLCHDVDCDGILTEWDTGIRCNYPGLTETTPGRFKVTWVPEDLGDWEHDQYACRTCVTEHRLPDAIIDEDWN